MKTLTLLSLAPVASAFVSIRPNSFATSSLFAKPKVFIDGEAGTTGLQVRDRLAKRDDLEILSISQELRKDENERKRLINEADAVILCAYLIRLALDRKSSPFSHVFFHQACPMMLPKRPRRGLNPTISVQC